MSLRHVLPKGDSVQAVKPADQAAFDRAGLEAGGAFGLRIELLVRRGQAGFRPAPLDTPLCPDDHVAFLVTPSEAGWLQILSHGGSDPRWQHVYPAPERPWEPTAFAPDTATRWPRIEGWGFPPDPVGPDHVMLVVSAQPPSAGLLGFQRRLLEGETSSSEAVTVSQLRDIGQAQSVHVVGDAEQVVAFTLGRVGDGEVCPALP